MTCVAWWYVWSYDLAGNVVLSAQSTSSTTLQAAKGKDSEEVAKAKATMIAEVTRELVVFFGVPPKTFT